MAAYREAHGMAAPAETGGRGGRGGGQQGPPREAWVTHFRNNTEAPGDFQKAWPVTDAINLAGIASRVGSIAFAAGNRGGAPDRAPPQRTGPPLLWDSQLLKFTIESFAIEVLSGEHRCGGTL